MEEKDPGYAHSSMGAICLLWLDTDWIPSRAVGSQNSMEIGTQNKGIRRGEGQVLTLRGALVDISAGYINESVSHRY